MGVYNRDFVMKIYLDGLEYRASREIMQDLGVRFATLNFAYLWYRTPQIDIEELTSGFDEVMVIPGNVSADVLYDYEIFLNRYSNYFTVALSPRKFKDCAVKIIPRGKGSEYYVTYGMLSKPFARPKFKAAAEKGALIHGFEIIEPWMNSCNSGTWMRGKAGWISHFDKRNKLVIHNEIYTITAFARELFVEGYDIDLNSVKRYDWQEMAKVNCIAWLKYQEYAEDK